MENILAELRHENISSQSDSRNNAPEIKQLVEYMTRHHEDLLKIMTDEQCDILERFDDCWSEYTSLVEETIFVCAFRLGVRMMLDVMLITTKK